MKFLFKAGVVGCEDFGEWINKGNQLKFCDHFLRAVVGHRRFDCDKKEILSNWITVSDEAFAMLVGENNIDRWIDMYRRDDKKNRMSFPDTLMVARAKSKMALLKDAKGGQ